MVTQNCSLACDQLLRTGCSKQGMSISQPRLGAQGGTLAQTNDNPFLGGEKLRLVKFSKCRNVLFVVTVRRPNSKILHLFTFSGAAETQPVLRSWKWSRCPGSERPHLPQPGTDVNRAKMDAVRFGDIAEAASTLHERPVSALPAEDGTRTLRAASLPYWQCGHPRSIHRS